MRLVVLPDNEVKRLRTVVKPKVINSIGDYSDISELRIDELDDCSTEKSITCNNTLFSRTGNPRLPETLIEEVRDTEKKAVSVINGFNNIMYAVMLACITYVLLNLKFKWWSSTTDAVYSCAVIFSIIYLCDVLIYNRRINKLRQDLGDIHLEAESGLRICVESLTFVNNRYTVEAKKTLNQLSCKYLEIIDKATFMISSDKDDIIKAYNESKKQ